jgi:Calcineurin-like phosphoesterase
MNMLRESCANTNIFFMERDTLVFQGVRFIACTLWTDLLKSGEQKAHEVSLRLNDFRIIRFKEQAFDQAAFTQLHRRSLLWLENELAEPFSGKTVVVTHHAPSDLSWRERPNELKKLAYCNSLDSLILQHKISAWFHGHIHSPNDYMLGETRVLSNPRGYHNRKEVEGFSQNKMVDI